MLKHLSIFFSLSLLVLSANASLVSEAVHKELTSTLSTRARALRIPRSQEACILREASSFRPVMGEGVAKYDIVKYRVHVLEAMKTCMPERFEVGSTSVRTVRSGRASTGRCGCRSKCHFCCVAAGLGGQDGCFKVVCKGADCLGEAKC